MSSQWALNEAVEFPLAGDINRMKTGLLAIAHKPVSVLTLKKMISTTVNTIHLNY